jgi:hypothetical protein
MDMGDKIATLNCAALTARNVVSVSQVHVIVNHHGLVIIVSMPLAQMNAITEESVS